MNTVKLFEKVAWLFVILPGFLSFAIISLIVDLGHLRDMHIIIYSFALTLLNLSIALPFYIVIATLYKHAMGVLATHRKNGGRSDGADHKNDSERTEDSDVEGKVAQQAYYRHSIMRELPFPLGFYMMMFPVSFLSGYIIAVAAESDAFYSLREPLAFIGFPDVETSKTPLGYLLYANTRDQISTRKLDHIFQQDAMSPGAPRAWIRMRTEDGTWYAGYPRLYGLQREPTYIYLSPACYFRPSQRDFTTPQAVLGPGLVVHESKIELIYFDYEEESSCNHLWNAKRR